MAIKHTTKQEKGKPAPASLSGWRGCVFVLTQFFKKEFKWLFSIIFGIALFFWDIQYAIFYFFGLNYGQLSQSSNKTSNYTKSHQNCGNDPLVFFNNKK